jgi:hypothetical protein
MTFVVYLNSEVELESMMMVVVVAQGEWLKLVMIVLTSQM